MALLTFGTNANNSLSAVKFNHSSGVMSDSDMAAANALIKSDSGNSGMLGNYFDRAGKLWIPRRGWVSVLQGDYVVVDSTGWPTLFSANAIANGPYTHS